MENGKVIHNCGLCHMSDVVQNPEEFVRSLLTRLVNVMKGNLFQKYSTVACLGSCECGVCNGIELFELNHKLALRL